MKRAIGIGAVLLVLAACTKSETNTDTNSNTGSSASSTASTTASSDTTASSAPTTVTSPAGEVSPPPPANMQPADREFAEKASRSGMAEVQLANKVTARASSPEVRNFATQMIQDHDRSNQELTKLAAGKHLDPPADLDPEHKALDQELSKLSGAALDKRYMEAMVKDHQIAVTDFTNASTQLNDADFKAFAAKTLPTLQHHLQMAQQIAGKLK